MIPFCSSVQIAASILRSAPALNSDYGQTVIALINRSKQTCTITAYPKLVFEHDGTALTVRVSPEISSYQQPAISVPPGGSATETILWPNYPDVPQYVKCNPNSDLWIQLRSGIPLYVPTGLNVCGTVEQSPLSGPPLPSPYDAAAAYDSWLGQQGCESRFASVRKNGQAAAPSSPDALDVNSAVSKSGTDFSGVAPPGVVEHSGMATDAATVLFDPKLEMIGSSDYQRGDASSEDILCTATRSVPYGVATGSLAAVTTQRGIGIGTTMAKTASLDGKAPVIALDGAYSGVHYAWKNKQGAYDLIYLFYKSRVIAIDYRKAESQP